MAWQRPWLPTFHGVKTRMTGFSQNHTQMNIKWWASQLLGCWLKKRWLSHVSPFSKRPNRVISYYFWWSLPLGPVDSGPNLPIISPSLFLPDFIIYPLVIKNIAKMAHRNSWLTELKDGDFQFANCKRLLEGNVNPGLINPKRLFNWESTIEKYQIMTIGGVPP